MSLAPAQAGAAHPLAPAQAGAARPLAPAQAGVSMNQSRSSHRGPGLRRGERDEAGTDVLLHAVLEVAGVVG